MSVVFVPVLDQKPAQRRARLRHDSPRARRRPALTRPSAWPPPSISTSRASGLVPVPAPEARHAVRLGQGRGARRAGARRGRRARHRRPPADAGTAAQSRDAPGTPRCSTAPDSFSRSSASARARGKGACRSSSPISSIRRAGSCAPGPISNGSAAASAFSAVRARRRSRPTAGSSANASIVIHKELEQVRRTRALHRKSRQRVPYPAVALVGYTNAGKSTLFNTLTGADVVAEDILFATLDPTIRALRLPRRLEGRPLRYRGLHLRPADHARRRLPRHPGRGAAGRPDPACPRHRRRGERRASAPTSTPCSPISASTPTPSPTGCSRSGTRPIFSTPPARAAPPTRRSAMTRSSCPPITGEGLDVLLAEIETRLNRRRQTVEIALDPQEGALSNWIYENCEVVARANLGDGMTSLRDSRRAREARQARAPCRSRAAPRHDRVAGRLTPFAPCPSRARPPSPHPRVRPSRRASRPPACGRLRPAPPRCSRTGARISHWRRAARLPDRSPRCRARLAMTKSRSPNSSATRSFDRPSPSSAMASFSSAISSSAFSSTGREMRPIEPDLCRTLLQLHRPCQTRQADRHVVQRSAAAIDRARLSLPP